MDKNLVFTKKLITTAAFLLIVFFVVNGLASNNTGDEGLDSDEYSIKPVSFESTVLSRGTIKPAMVIPIKSQIAGAKSKLVWAMADGQYADKGDVIARFDTTKYEEDLIRSEQTMEDAKATLMAAEKALVLQREEEVKKKENASRRLDIAI
jgi:multidrug efflux pump subunit AcrA (membrane-fusion protein)